MKHKRKFLYGFKNKKTGLFKSDYKTIRYKTKNACFKTYHNAEKSLQYQKNKEDYIVSRIVEVEVEQ